MPIIPAMNSRIPSPILTPVTPKSRKGGVSGGGGLFSFASFSAGCMPCESYGAWVGVVVASGVAALVVLLWLVVAGAWTACAPCWTAGVVPGTVGLLAAALFISCLGALAAEPM